MASFTAYNNPNNHMSNANWKFDYKTLPWENLLHKTGDAGCDIKDGHYRKHSKIRQKQKNDHKMELIDAKFNHYDRYKGIFITFILTLFFIKINPQKNKILIGLIY